MKIRKSTVELGNSLLRTPLLLSFGALYTIIVINIIIILFSGILTLIEKLSGHHTSGTNHFIKVEQRQTQGEREVKGKNSYKVKVLT